jgi:beta-phosphoglucomutase-like phosphatase (HAD superfamily)
VLGLPDPVSACLFDLDGVLTQTARLHAAAWKEMFDGYLRSRAERTGEPFVPFRLPADYDDYVDGRPRADGARTFLHSRGIVLPRGGSTDTAADETVRGLGNTKNAIVLRKMAKDGVDVYPGSVRYVRAARDAGLARAVVSASTNCRDVLAAAGIGDLFDVVMDGIAAERQRLRGKPAPDTYLAAVFEDALAGVAAGRAGGFAWMVGVDRVSQRDALRREGADVVITDLADLLPAP